MNPIVKNVLAVIAGVIVGSLVNMGIVIGGSALIPPPAGVNVMDMESIKSAMHLFGPQHFITPFVAHAAGTLAGAFVAAKIAASHQMKLALAIGVLYLAGGISAVMSLPAPMWFNVLDLVGAYLPMAWLGGKLAGADAA